MTKKQEYIEFAQMFRAAAKRATAAKKPAEAGLWWWAAKAGIKQAKKEA